MTSQTAPPQTTIPPWLEERIKRHKVEVARLREQFGDPAEALNQWVRDHFDPEDLVLDDRGDYGSNGMMWEDDDSDTWYGR